MTGNYSEANIVKIDENKKIITIDNIFYNNNSVMSNCCFKYKLLKSPDCLVMLTRVPYNFLEHFIKSRS